MSRDDLDFFDDDVQHLRCVLACAGIQADDATVDRAWAAYSESMDAGWLAPPADAAEAVRMIKPFLTPKAA